MRKKRSPETELWVAEMQGPIIGLHREEGLAEMLDLIDKKGGDYYQPYLRPEGDDAWNAYNNIPYAPRLSPLQQDIITEMKQYYGKGNATPKVKATEAKEAASDYVEEKIEEVIEDNPEYINQLLDADRTNRIAITSQTDEDMAGILASLGIGLAIGGGGIAATKGDQSLTDEQILALKAEGLL